MNFMQKLEQKVQENQGSDKDSPVKLQSEESKRILYAN